MFPKKAKAKGYWQDIENRRRFFEEFAKTHGFDPRDWTKWATITTTQLAQNQVYMNAPFLEGNINYNHIGRIIDCQIWFFERSSQAYLSRLRGRF